MTPISRRSLSLSLSDLPDTAINEILCRLPFKLAVRTSLLSRSWRRRWQSIPDLSFLPNQMSSHDISRALLLHSAPLRLFWVEEPPTDGDRSNVHVWLAVVSRRSASSLRTLRIVSKAVFNADLLAGYFPNLTLLDLNCPLIVQPQFRGFTAFRSLYLIGFGYACGLSRLVSACPLLETLTVMHVHRRQSLDIVAPNLRWLVLFNVRLDDFAVTSAPVLEMAKIHDCFDDDVSGDGSNDDSDNEDGDDGGSDSDDVSVNDNGDGGRSDNEGGGGGGTNNHDRVSGSQKCYWMNVFQGMASMKTLETDQYFLRYVGRGHIPERSPINFEHLRVMSFYADFGYMKEVLVALSLLRSAPNLQKLTIRGLFSGNVLETGNDFWEAQEHIDLFGKLETMNIRMRCTDDELGFVQFVLAKARVLKTVMIRFDNCYRNKESIMTKLLGFTRVSSQARILL